KRDRRMESSVVRMLDVAEQKELWRGQEMDDSKIRLAFSADGKFLGHAVPIARVQVCQAADAKILHYIPLPGEIQHVAFSPDGKTLVLRPGEGSKVIQLWDLPTEKKRSEILVLPHLRDRKLDDRIWGSKATFLPDGIRLLVSMNQYLSVWD